MTQLVVLMLLAHESMTLDRCLQHHWGKPDGKKLDVVLLEPGAVQIFINKQLAPLTNCPKPLVLHRFIFPSVL